MRLLLFSFLILLSIPLFAQYTKYASEDKKALKYYEEARAFLKRAQFREAVEPLNKAIDRDPNFIEVWLAYGSMHGRTGNDSLSAYCFGKALEIDPDYHKSKYAYYTIGAYHLKKGKYEQAHEYLMHYLKTDPGDPKKEDQARDKIRNCRFAMEAIKKPFDYNIQLLPDYANQFMLQYFPTLSVDQKTIYFTRREGLGQNQDEDIFFTNRQDNGSWSIPKSISPNINTTDNEGAASISADGRTLVFTNCEGKRGYGSCDIYVSYKKGKEWSAPRNMGREINSESWEAQPTLSSDGRTIFFVSQRSTGFGGKDIWFATKDRRGRWEPAMNLGPIVNTSKNDIAPFIHSNGESLFFSSKGHEGMGGLDLFMTELKDSVWTTPANLGYPLNDSYDQVSICIGSEGKRGVFTIEKKIERTIESKLYSFELPDSVQVSNQSAYLKGTVVDADTGLPITAKIKIYKLDDPNYYSELKSDAVEGDFTIVLVEGNTYGVYITSRGYVFKDFSFSFEDMSSFDHNLLNIKLDPVKVGAKTVLGNIFFEFDEYSLKRESMSELKVVYNFLRNNPKVKVEISGHTDSRGSRAYNMELSRKRAQNVYDFLLKKGIRPSQLTFRGYGFDQPHVININEVEDAKNRRIEFKIIETE
ncbi:MAG: PD40 domain-containing protein [Reichenbachiella sp.]